MNIRHSIRITAAAVALAAVAGTTALAGPARALPADGSEPTDPPDRADLKLSALSVSASGSAWSIGYTVQNGGSLGAGATTLALGGGPGVAVSVPIPSLAAGATRSGTVQVTRADCYVYVHATADSGRVVTESNETNNVRTAIGAVPGCPPRYKVSAAYFKAIEESGVDWTGSDEAYWIFSGVSNTGTAATRASQVYGSMDTGDTQVFATADSCVWGCSAVGETAPFGIGLSVQLWEQDYGQVSEVWDHLADAFQAAGPIASAAGAPAWVSQTTSKIGDGIETLVGWIEDDLMGSNTYAFSADGLAAALPNRGTSFTDTRIYEHDGAKYSLTMTIRRVV